MDDAGTFVIACDSVGGIGPKPADTYRVDAWTTAHFATRVPLLEVLCVGAQPAVVVNTLSVESEGIGAEMIASVRDSAARVGVPATAVTGSTEDNVLTTATGIGVTVIGHLPANHRPFGSSVEGDVLLCVGLPRSAPKFALRQDHPDLVTLEEVRAALDSSTVHDALPVGSKGLAWEGPQIAQAAGLRLRWRNDHGVDVTASGGPSSCVLFSCDPDDLSILQACFAPERPAQVVADIESVPS